MGTASDATGAKVAGAKVTLTGVGTNVSRQPPPIRLVIIAPESVAGTYRIDMEASSFKHFVRTPVEVQVDSATRVNAAMELGAVTETVEVTTSAPLLQIESGSMGSEVEG